jgi:hypothetical protein
MNEQPSLLCEPDHIELGRCRKGRAPLFDADGNEIKGPNPQSDVEIQMLKRVAGMREEDRAIRRGYALGFAVGFFMWAVVIIFCWVVVKVAGPPPVPTDPHYSERPEPDALKRGRTPAP